MRYSFDIVTVCSISKNLMFYFPDVLFRMFYFLRPAPTIGVGKNRFIMKSEISPARFFIIKSLISFLLSIKSETSPRLIIKSEISFRLSIKSSSSSPEIKINPYWQTFAHKSGGFLETFSKIYDLVDLRLKL